MKEQKMHLHEGELTEKVIGGGIEVSRELGSGFLIELKAIKSLTSEHDARLINYLKATGLKVGLLMNFGRSKLDWKRLVH